MPGLASTYGRYQLSLPGPPGMRLAATPLIAWRSPPLAAAAHPGAFWPSALAMTCVRGRELGPSRTRRDIEDTDIAAGQQVERLLDLILLVKLRAAWRAERFEPCGIDEVRHHGAVNRVAVIVRFAGVAYLVCVDPPALIVGLYEDGQINIRVGQHLKQFMAGSDRPLQPVLDIGAGEDLPQRQALGGQIVISQCSRLIRIVEDDQRPRTRLRLAPGHKLQIGVDSPGGCKVISNLCLQCRHRLTHLVVSERLALI